MDALFDSAGFDASLVRRLAPAEQTPFVVSSCLAFLSSGLGALSLSYMAAMSTESLIAAIVIGAVACLFVLNIARLINAGGGRPIQGEHDDIDEWRPSIWPPLVLIVFGALFCHGGALLSAVLLDLPGLSTHHTGLVDVTTAAWKHPTMMAGLCGTWALAFAAFSWTRLFMLRGVRAYERLRWREGRGLVDREFNRTNADIIGALATWPSFDGTLRFYFTNPPYNTHRMLFGIDEARVEKRGLQFLSPSAAPPPLPKTPTD